VFEAEEDDSEGIPDEISRLLEHEGKTIQPHEEPLKVINLGSEEDKKADRIGALLDGDVKSKLTEFPKSTSTRLLSQRYARAGYRYCGISFAIEA
jgi:hypothetical protein